MLFEIIQLSLIIVFKRISCKVLIFSHLRIDFLLGQSTSRTTALSSVSIHCGAQGARTPKLCSQATSVSLGSGQWRFRANIEQGSSPNRQKMF